MAGEENPTRGSISAATSTQFGATREMATSSEQDDQQMQAASGQSGSVSQSLQSSAQNLTREARQEGKKLASDIRRSATHLAEEQKSVVANYLSAMGDAFSAGGDALDERGYNGTSHVVRRLGDEIDNLAETLADKDSQGILTEIGDYARNNPAVFIGTAVLAGFGLVRLLKSGEQADEAEADDEYYDFEEDENQDDA